MYKEILWYISNICYKKFKCTKDFGMNKITGMV